MSSTMPTRYFIAGTQFPWQLWRQRSVGRLDRWDGGAWVPAHEADTDWRETPEVTAKSLFPVAFATNAGAFAKGRAFAVATCLAGVPSCRCVGGGSIRAR